MTGHPYPIPAATARIENVVDKSRFIATIGYADSVPMARAFIQAMREEFADASSHIYAFKVGYGASITEGVSDGGEPTGTAGPPVLAVIKGADLGDVVITVTRYFGGIKLGTGGLVHAFGDAARAALAALPTRLKIAYAQVGLTVPYPIYERVRLLATAHLAVIDSEDFGAEVTLYLTLPADQVQPLQAAVTELSAGRVALILL